MSIVVSIFLGTLFVILPSSYGRISERIIGGQVARSAEFPWQAAIYVDTNDGKFFCGGSLINNQWIITAGHCVYYGRIYTIHLGANKLQAGDPNRLILATSNGVVYPDFDPYTLENDIGLIKLHIPIVFTDYIKPITLGQPGDAEEGSPAVVAGWGQISDSVTGIVNDLRWVDVMIISNDECQVTYGDQIKDTMICTAGNFNEGICVGDTGGPLLTREGGNNYRQIGVAGFFSLQGCETLHPSGFTRIDPYHEWITNTTNISF